jgi:Protein of unknown function (DUF1552)
MQSIGTRLSRRHVLRRAGVSLALPLLNGMLSGSAMGAPSQFKPWKESKAVQPRVIYCYVPNGVNILEWVPKTLGTDYELSPTLSVLKDHKADFSVISGIGHYNASGGHSGADTWLTGANLKAVPGSDYSNTISIDQVIAEKHGKETRIPSLELSDQSGTGGSGHSHTLSFDRTGTPLPAEDSPRRLFERLFVPETAADRAATLRRYAARKSVLDSVLSDAKGLKKKLGTEDKKKLEQYLSSVRQTEERVERLERWVDVEKPQVDPSLLQLASLPSNAHDRPMWLDVMLELTYLSFACDVTRVVTFEWSREAGGYGGGGENHHELSHHGGDEGMLAKLATIDRFHLERLGRFIGFLKETDEAGNRMLDNTVIVFGSGMNSGERGDHSPHNLPLLVAGGKKLGFQHGQHLAFGDGHAAKEPLSAVLLATARGMGVEQEKFVDAASPLPGLMR